MADLDKTNLNWTLKTAPDENNDAQVELGCDGSVQTIAFPDVSSDQAIIDFMNAYVPAYITGKQQETDSTTNHPSISQLVGQTNEAKTN